MFCKLVYSSESMKITCAILIIFFFGKGQCSNSPWKWECVEGYCQKKLVTENTTEALSLAECRLKCSKFAALWPIPTISFTTSENLIQINPDTIQVDYAKTGSPVSQVIPKAVAAFKENINSNKVKLLKETDKGLKLSIRIEVKDQESTRLNLGTDESYILDSNTENNVVTTNIIASTYFGARHALETLGQLIVFDDLRDVHKMPSFFHIEDKPAYPYRGILLDTSRNYVSVDTIKRTINAMGASKLNTFHWHITDSHSFPYQSKSLPDLSRYGAYSPKKVYTPEDIADIIDFAQSRGVRVMPEFDAPAHVGEGWQNTGFVTCFNKQPWMNYCVEPPCGQFDPTIPGLYDALEALYGDMVEQFQPDIFHMGGDEVHFGCWNSTESIVQWMSSQDIPRNEEGFIKVWDKFQNQAAERLYRRTGRQIPIILWTSTLTKRQYLHHLPNNQYIIQIWTLGNDPQVKDLLDMDYNLILSNYDALYFDCGFAAWVTSGNNWCSPYIGWQKVYENTPQKIAGSRKNQILGSEATLWTEQADDTSIDSRLWPRAAALAEQLWSEPSTGWRDAEPRFLVHRERLVNRGIAADAIEPEWCRQNEENCPIGGKFVHQTSPSGVNNNQ